LVVALHRAVPPGAPSSQHAARAAERAPRDRAQPAEVHLRRDHALVGLDQRARRGAHRGVRHHRPHPAVEDPVTVQQDVLDAQRDVGPALAAVGDVEAQVVVQGHLQRTRDREPILLGWVGGCACVGHTRILAAHNCTEIGDSTGRGVRPCHRLTPSAPRNSAQPLSTIAGLAATLAWNDTCNPTTDATSARTTASSMIRCSRVASSEAVAAGMISISFTSTLPIALRATTTATATIVISAYSNSRAGRPTVRAIAGSYDTNSSSR